MTTCSNDINPIKMAASLLSLVMDKIGFIAAVLFGLLVTISTAGTSISMAIIVISFVLGLNWKKKILLLLEKPTLLLLIALIAWVIIGALYSPAEPHRIAMMIRKTSYLLIVWFMYYFIKDNIKRFWIVTAAFSTGCILNLVVIYLNSYVLPYNESITFSNFSIIHHGHVISAIDHFGFAFITLTFSFSCLLFAVKYKGKTRVLLLLAGLIALYAEVFLNSARTGYMMELATVILMYTIRYGKKGAFFATIFIMLLFTSAYKLSPVFHQRIDQAYKNITAFHQHKTNNTSVGLRLGWYSVSFDMLRQRNIGQLAIGSGTGSIKDSSINYLQKNSNKFPKSFKYLVIDNPHDQFFLITVENGMIGLLLTLAIFLSIVLHGRKLLYPWNYISYVVIIGMVIGCLFNSWLRDFTMVARFILMSSLLLSCPYQQKNNTQDLSNSSTNASS